MSYESKKIKLLLVDDEVDFLASLTKRLEKRDFDITAATEGNSQLRPPQKWGLILRS
jgi:ActR/RegA family two-component response regulator